MAYLRRTVVPFLAWLLLCVTYYYPPPSITCLPCLLYCIRLYPALHYMGNFNFMSLSTTRACVLVTIVYGRSVPYTIGNLHLAGNSNCHGRGDEKGIAGERAMWRVHVLPPLIFMFRQRARPTVSLLNDAWPGRRQRDNKKQKMSHQTSRNLLNHREKRRQSRTNSTDKETSEASALLISAH